MVANAGGVTYRDLPALGEAAQPFAGAGWIFELKYDGFRVLATREGERVTLLSRRGTNLLPHPEIGESLRALPPLALDGELVVLDSDGRPQFERLRRRLALKRPAAIAQAAAAEPAVVFAFDLLELRARDLRARPLIERKALLERVLRGAQRVRYAQHVNERGERLFAMAEEMGLEGIVAKKAAAPYPRGRTTDWLKIRTAVGRAIGEARRNW